MKKVLKALLFIFIVTAIVNNSIAQPMIPHSVIASGGGFTASGNFAVTGTFGQSAIGVADNPSEMTNAGFWYVLKSNVVSVEGEEETVPVIFELKQNYPNPFNPTTIIKFSVAERAFTKIKIYDILGAEVAELVNKELEPGVYELNFSAGKLSSGVYIYRMTSGSFTDVKKMNLIK